MTTSTMTRQQAEMFRAAYEGAVKRYSKMTKVQLRNENLIALSEAGMQRIAGGPVSKDELISDTLRLRGYTTEKLNEATHAQYHEPGIVGSTACKLCVCQVTWVNGDGFLLQCEGEPGHDGMHQAGQSFYAAS